MGIGVGRAGEEVHGGVTDVEDVDDAVADGEDEAVGLVDELSEFNAGDGAVLAGVAEAGGHGGEAGDGIFEAVVPAECGVIGAGGRDIRGGVEGFLTRFGPEDNAVAHGLLLGKVEAFADVGEDLVGGDAGGAAIDGGEAVADDALGVDGVEGIEKALIGLGVLDDDAGAAVDGQNFRAAGCGETLDVRFVIAEERGEGVDVAEVDHGGLRQRIIN